MSADDRIQRMLNDPEAYFAEARDRARALVERDLKRDRERRQRERQDARRRSMTRAWCFLVHRWWVPTAWAPMVTVRDSYICVRCGQAWSRP